MAEAKVFVNKLERRRKALVPLGARLPKILKTAAGKQGFVEGDLVLHWRRVCPEYFKCSRPLSLKGGTLRVGVNSDSAKLQFQYWIPTLKQRLAQFYGTEVVQRVVLVNTVFATVEAGNKQIDEPPERLDARCGVVKDDDLRQALLSLSKWLK